jgi:DNA primase
MTFTIPEDIVEKVREAADIVEVISDHVTLRQTGRSFKALCPFHPEKTPSFVVSREKQIYHCFGCGAGGNAINFIMQFENVTFPEAVRSLAKRYGITVPRTAPQASSEMDFAYRLNAVAAKIYRSALSGTKEGTQARAYLRQRGVGEEIEQEFMLGYAPSEGNLLLQEARRLKIDPARLVSLGLAVGTGRDLRDMFRRRLMFPVISAGGRTLGFGGRVLDAAVQPKYLNSPETRAFRKSNTLYGVHAAKGQLRAAGAGIVVEGYMDVIALHAHGISNAVASLGTAFTPEQGRALRRYADTAVFMYDGDRAGSIAALRACAVAAEADLKTSVVRLPDGEDPDSFVRKAGKSALAELIEGAMHYIDFILSEARGRDVEETVKFALAVVARMKDPIRASLDLKRLAERSGVDRAALAKSLAAIKSKGGREAEKPRAAADDQAAPCDKVEKSLISILIGSPEFAGQVFENLSPSDFVDQRMRRIAEIICDRRSRDLGFDASALLTAVEDEPVRAMLIECSMSSQAGDTGRIVSDHILCVKKRGVAREIEDLRRQIRTAEKEGDRRLLETLLAKRQELAHELKLLST